MTGLPDLTINDLGPRWTDDVDWIWSASHLGLGGDRAVAERREVWRDLWWSSFGGPWPPRGIGDLYDLYDPSSLNSSPGFRASSGEGSYRYVVDARGRVARIGNPVPAIGILRGSPSDVLPRVVVSGAQTGADRGALDAALGVGWSTAGWVPRGWRAEDGVIPVRYRETLRVSESASYASRTRQNVALGTGTLIVSPDAELSGGSWQTLEFARIAGSPRLHARPQESGVADRVLAWVAECRVGVLNVAGPRESRRPGIQRAVQDLIGDVLASVASRRGGCRG